MGKFKTTEYESFVDDKEECTSDPLLSIERVETPDSYEVRRAIVWTVDGLMVGDFESKFFVKLIGFVFPGSGSNGCVRLCVQKFREDTDDVKRMQCWILGAGLTDMDEIAKAIELGPVIEDSRQDGSAG